MVTSAFIFSVILLSLLCCILSIYLHFVHKAQRHNKSIANSAGQDSETTMVLHTGLNTKTISTKRMKSIQLVHEIKTKSSMHNSTLEQMDALPPSPPPNVPLAMFSTH